MKEHKRHKLHHVLKRKDSPQTKEKAIGTLTVTLIEADLPRMDRLGLSDGYCYISFENERHKSKTIFRTLHPIWNQEFNFEVEHPDSVVTIDVWDHNHLLNDAYIGTIQMNLMDLKQEESEGWYPLKKKNCISTKTVGNVHLKWDYHLSKIHYLLYTPKKKEKEGKEKSKQKNEKAFEREQQRRLMEELFKVGFKLIPLFVIMSFWVNIYRWKKWTTSMLVLMIGTLLFCYHLEIFFLFFVLGSFLALKYFKEQLYGESMFETSEKTMEEMLEESSRIYQYYAGEPLTKINIQKNLLQILKTINYYVDSLELAFDTRRHYFKLITLSLFICALFSGIYDPVPFTISFSIHSFRFGIFCFVLFLTCGLKYRFPNLSSIVKRKMEILFAQEKDKEKDIKEQAPKKEVSAS